MKIAVVDDERNHANEIISMFCQVLLDINGPEASVDYYPSVTSFEKAWQDKDYDVVFLDIFLTDGSGVELARKIRDKNETIRIVFCSTSNEFATESYDVQASYYLTKPVSYDNMKKMAGKLLRDMKAEKDFLVLPDGQMLLFRQIIYSEYYNHQIKIILKDAPDLRTWMSQQDFLSIICKYDNFLPITPGTVINMNEVRSFNRDSFVMSDTTMLYVSRSRKKEILEKYTAFLFNQLRKY